jgi:hypothetical protein
MSTHENLKLTHHAQTRMFERWPELTSQAKPLPTAPKLKFLYSFLLKAVENKRFKNDIRLMLYLQERYGYDKSYRMLINGDMLFIIIDLVIVTVISLKNHVSPHVQPVPPAAERQKSKPAHFERPTKTLNAGSMAKFKRNRRKV